MQEKIRTNQTETPPETAETQKPAEKKEGVLEFDKERFGEVCVVIGNLTMLSRGVRDFEGLPEKRQELVKQTAEFASRMKLKSDDLSLFEAVLQSGDQGFVARASRNLSNLLECSDWLDLKLVDTLAEILEKNLSLIESFSKETGAYSYYFDAAYSLAREFRKTGIDALIHSLEHLAMNMEFDFRYAEYLSVVLWSGNPEGVSHVVKVLESKIYNTQSGEIKSFALLAWAFVLGSPSAKLIASSILTKAMEKFELPKEKFFEVWRQSLPVLDTTSSFYRRGRNLELDFFVMEKLESDAPGAVTFLNKKFGIFNFGRYPFQVLRSQYLERDNDDIPYGVVFYPRYDHNGSFYFGREFIQDAFGKLREFGYTLRVGEGEGKLDIVKLLERLHRKYGSKHRISFAVVGGHGRKEDIRFGTGSERSQYLRIEDFLDTKHPASNIKKYFKEGCTFILRSCSTGIEGGIGQKLSKVLEADVIAPDKDAGAPLSVKIEENEGRLKFSLEYGVGVETKRYGTGQLISEDR